MRHWLAGLMLLVAPSAFAQQAVPTIAFDSVPNPLKLPPNMYFGEVSGVSVNSKGHVFALSRGNTSGPAYAAAATQLLEFDAQGKFIREIGKNLYAWSFGHTVKIDPQDNIWVTDTGSDMVIKFDPEGRVLMVFGRKQEASDEDTGPVKHPKPPLPSEDGRFRQVTDVAWDPQGNTFISDGYINSRVAKVDKDGNWIKSWGDRGKEPGQFNTPHSIARQERSQEIEDAVIQHADVERGPAPRLPTRKAGVLQLREQIERGCVAANRLHEDLRRHARQRNPVSRETLHIVVVRIDRTEVRRAVARDIHKSSPRVFDADIGELGEHAHHALPDLLG